MVNQRLQKIKGLILFELETSAQFPIFELYFFFLNILLLDIILNTNFYIFSSLESIPSIPDLFIQNILSINYYLFFNGLFLGLLINNSFLSESEQAFLPTILSYPISKSLYLSTKIGLYSIFNFIITLFIVLLGLITSPYGLNITIILLLIVTLLINELFTIFIALIILLFFKKSLISNFLILLTWFIWLFPLFSINQAPIFIRVFIYPFLLLNLYTSNSILDIILCFCFSFVITGLTFLILIKKYNTKEIV